MNSILRRAVPTALLAGGVLLAGGGVAAGQLPVGDGEGLGGLDELTGVGDIAGGGSDSGLGALGDLQAGDLAGLDDLTGVGGGSGSGGLGLSGVGSSEGVEGAGGTLDTLCDGPLSIVGSVGGGLCDDSSGGSSVTGLSEPKDAEPAPSQDGDHDLSSDALSTAGATIGTVPPHELPMPLGAVCTEPYTTVKNVRSFCDVHSSLLPDVPATDGDFHILPEDGLGKGR